MNPKRAIFQILKHLKTTGVTHIPKVTLPKPSALSGPSSRVGAGIGAKSSQLEPQSRRSGNAAVVRQPAAAAGAPNRTPGALLSRSELDASAVQRPDSNADALRVLQQTYSDAAEKKTALCELANVVAKCTRCHDLASTRKQTVFGVGNPDARIMFIGEAPGADEDAQGEPFVGKAGQLLDRIIQACLLTREEIYICNILRCRPPGNRTPLPQEAANCREYLDAQIHVVKPEYIVCWGSVAAQNLLNDKRPIGKMRGEFMSYQDARVLCTYHPSYLLRYPAAKTQVWEDMKLLMRDMGVELK